MTHSAATLGRTLWRRLLQIDQPIPNKSEAEIEAEIEQNYRWNFSVNLLDGAAFWFGLNFISASTILPLFVSKLTPNPLLIGLVAVIAQAGWPLPQLFTAGFIEKLARKKPITVNLGFMLERLPTWLWVFAAFVALSSPSLALVIFFIGYTGFQAGAGIVAPAWQDLIARCFPVERRGRFFGTTAFIGTGVGAIGAIFSGWLLDAYAFPFNFVIIFFIGALAINLSWAFQALTREPVWPIKPTPHIEVRFWPRLRQILRGDPNFRNFLLARLVLAFGLMGLGFVTVAAIQRLDIPDQTVGFYTAALLIGQTIGNLLTGWLADRFGHKRPLEITGLAAGAAFVLAWWSPVAGWYFVIFALLGLSIGTMIVSGTLISMEFSAPEQRPTYVGFSNTVWGIGGGISPLIGGWLATFNYDSLFAVSAIISFGGAMMMRWLVHDPRWKN